jgi:hypothetical protein
VTEGSIVEPLRIGVLGAGRITSLSLVAPARSTGHRLVAVAARWSVRAAVFAAEAAAAGFTGFGLLSDDLPAAVAEYGAPRHPNDVGGQWNRARARRSRVDPLLVGLTALTGPSPTGFATPCSEPRRSSTLGTSR